MPKYVKYLRDVVAGKRRYVEFETYGSTYVAWENSLR